MLTLATAFNYIMHQTPRNRRRKINRRTFATFYKIIFSQLMSAYNDGSTLMDVNQTQLNSILVRLDLYYATNINSLIITRQTLCESLYRTELKIG